MSTDTAAKYADELVARIEADVEAGHPFGISEGYGDTPEGEPLTALDYLTDGLLDAEVIRSLGGDYRGARLMVGAGGPNVWIDTRRGVLEVAWWSEPVTVQLPREFTDALDEAVEELSDLVAPTRLVPTETVCAFR